jgi:hypothetical protein
VKLSNYAALFVAIAAVACTPAKTAPIAVAGDATALAGKWVGEYESSATGRSGSIVFNLSPTGEAATGDVVMIPRGYGKALVPYGDATTANATTVTPQSNDASRRGANLSQVLTIRLVQVTGDSVSGVLDSYRDPECDCAVQTTFAGHYKGDTIEGSFITRGKQSNAPQTGTWRVKRGD